MSFCLGARCQRRVHAATGGCAGTVIYADPFGSRR